MELITAFLFILVGAIAGLPTQSQGKDSVYKIRIPKKLDDRHYDLGFVGGMINGAVLGAGVFLIYMIIGAMNLYIGLLFSMISSMSGCSIIEIAKRMLGINLNDPKKNGKGNNIKN